MGCIERFSSLFSFGQLVTNELCLMFEPDSNIVIPFSESMAVDICERNGLTFDKVKAEFIDYFMNRRLEYNFCNISSCVFQVIVAYKCISNNNQAYNEELSKYLHISISDLQLIYSEKLGMYSNPQQEHIWINVKEYLKKHCNLSLIIPQQKEFSGRYVQYPKNQQLFKLSDFSQLEKRFKQRGLFSSPPKTFQEFTDRAFGKNEKICNNSGLDYISQRSIEPIALRIAFYCFCNWIERDIRNNSNKNKPKEKSKSKKWFSIQINTNDQTFILFKNGKETTPKSEREIITKSYFVFDEIFGEWSMVTKVSNTDFIGTCIDAIGKSSLESKYPIAKKYTCMTDNSILFFVLPKGTDVSNRWDIQKPPKKKLIGGLKDEVGDWIPGLLPFVEFGTDWNGKFFYIDSERINASCQKYDLNEKDISPGIHVIKFPGEIPFEFKVARTRPHKIDSGGWNWNLKTSQITYDMDNWVLSGLNVLETFLVETSEAHEDFWGNSYMEKCSSRFKRFNDIESRFN